MNILVSPLDWGLGHATRVTSVIRQRLAEGHRVIIAGSGASLDLLSLEFPQLTTVQLPSFSPRFSKYAHQVQALAVQIPAFLRSIHDEYLATRRIVEEHAIDEIISDNRYGVRSERCKSVIIAHQLRPRISSLCPRPVEQMLAATLGQMLQKFDECHIPDIAPYPDGLAGELAKPLGTKLNIKYIGLMSRLPHDNLEHIPGVDTLCIVSGPEPQRSIFEQRLTEHFAGRPGRCVIVQGKPGRSEVREVGNIRLVPHCDAHTLASLISSAGIIVCRSGYSSVMDLYSLGKRAVLVPTPGQPEQEYLASHLVNFGFSYVTQKKISTL